MDCIYNLSDRCDGIPLITISYSITIACYCVLIPHVPIASIMTLCNVVLYRIVTQILTDVHEEIPCLNDMVNAIGNLDMILAFSDTSRQPDYGSI